MWPYCKKAELLLEEVVCELSPKWWKESPSDKKKLPPAPALGKARVGKSIPGKVNSKFEFSWTIASLAYLRNRYLLNDWIYGWMDGYLNGWVYIRMDGWRNGWISGWMDRGVNEWKVMNKKDNSRKWSDEVVTWLWYNLCILFYVTWEATEKV